MNQDDADKLIAILTEFTQDIEAVGTDEVQADWPDLMVTYRSAKQYLKQVRKSQKR